MRYGARILSGVSAHLCDESSVLSGLYVDSGSARGIGVLENRLMEELREASDD
jgi:hypothetical protein